MNSKKSHCDKIFKDREPSKYPFENVVSFILIMSQGVNQYVKPLSMFSVFKINETFNN
tara:strand:+ start:952 stop:1125 length:174 start_codon:yes stop_codon:yes gene_type:complete